MKEMRILLLRKHFRRNIRLFVTALIIITFICGHIFGLFIHPFEIDFASNFSYPLDIENLREIIDTIKLAHHTDDSEIPKPINQYNHRFLIINQNKCMKQMVNKQSDDSDGHGHNYENIVLLIVVKSALPHVNRRNAIRKSWGFEQRFSDVQIRTVFVLGSCDGRSDILKCQDMIDDESLDNSDVIQADFVDSYYNNTYKMMIAFKWIVNHCPNAQFILFVDDDYYVSVKNLLKFSRNPISIESLFESNHIDYDVHNRFDGRLYSGYVFPSSSPMRHKTSKWFVTLQEYPYSHYPPYVTAGAILLSNHSLVDMYYASLYTKHFRFDDIYVGILAKKVDITPLHNENFYFERLSYTPHDYSNVIASHGFDDTKELIMIWNEQKSLGNA